MRRVYLDHNATTPLDPRVFAAMQPYLSESFGNASSHHYHGRQAKQALEASRALAAKMIGTEPDEIIFTSGGTESDNLALRGIAHQKGSGHIITSSVEHHAVVRTCAALAEDGFTVTFLPVDRRGVVDPDEVKRAIRRDTILISVMLANNETGVIEPIPEIGLIARERGIPFHCDAVQGMGKIPVDVTSLHTDLLSLSAHKIYGPKGIGALFVKRGTTLAPFITGGHHERGLRAGTENVAAIVGFARALEIAVGELDIYKTQVLQLRNKLESNLRAGIEGITLHSDGADRLPHTSCMGFASVEAESILLHLDLKGVAASSGSACTTGEPEPSHVLTAMGVSPEIAQGTIRFSLGRENTAEEIDYTAEVLKAAVNQLRAISFPWQEAGTKISITG
jgi:cysteine desulfurase